MKRLLSILLVSGAWLLAYPNSYAMVDSNENDMSDVWEKNYNSNQLFAPSFLPFDDADGDSVSNLEESLAGTDPKDGKPPDGFLQTEVIHSPAVYINGDDGPEIFTPEAFSISWATVRGKRYTLLYSLDLSAGSWVPIGNSYFGHGYEITISVAPTQTGGGIPDKLFWRVAVDDIDTDGDGFNDYEEYALNTNPYIADRDGDGLPDEWEVAYDLDLDDNGTLDSSKGPNGDLDGDLLINLEEYYYNGDPRDADTDDDHLGDRSEAYEYYTYVDLADYDSDGLDDGEEILRTMPTDPRNWDSDNDTLSDGAEVKTHGTNPSLQDTDGDTLRDDWEIRYVFNPVESADGPTDPDGDGLKNPIEQLLRLHPRDNDSNDNGILDGAEDSDKDNLTNLSEVTVNPTNPTDPSKHDTDGDGLPDGWERLYFLDPKDTVGSNGRHGDPDGDLLENFDEYLNSTSPILASSDGNDGANDYQEVLLGTDPNVFSDGGGGGGGFISPSDPVEEATFRVGGDYASWRMEIKGMGPRDHRKFLAVSPQYGEWEDKNHKIRVNNSYEITLYHTGSRPEDDPPWYCWEAGISAAQSASASAAAGNPAPVDHTFAQAFTQSAPGSDKLFMYGENKRWIIDNREGVIAGHTHSQGENFVEGKKAKMIPVAISDNIEATGVDATSITADPEDPGYQNKYWIMAPSGNAPNGSACKNDMLFQIPLVPSAQMVISYPEGSPPPATPAPTTITLGTADAACSWHGESATTTEEPVPTYKIGDDEVELALPIHVKTMKRRTVKVAVYRVNELKSDGTTVPPDPQMLPSKAQLEQHLNQLFAYQINTWFEVSFVPQIVSVNFGNGVLESGIGDVHTPDQSAVIGAFGGLNTSFNVHLFIVGASSLIAQNAKGFTSPPNATSWVFASANGSYNDADDVMITIGHEIGHVFFGVGHPDIADFPGIAPLKGTDRSKRLMFSNPDLNSRLIVKKEWDAAETWLKARPNDN